ncbi:hypothetical protein RND71_041514 [Anisodus tanguticus]|uniref:KIB1-4 beta-propeller domain-containing protein n=1 Tax=Anisodus tanguticus TaxID=243964 RepID=A0AAE1QXU6_9SOLA|nr:hypothetical protein RND71_041514 [Anisodus tanguticus]
MIREYSYKWTRLRGLSSKAILDIIVYKGNFYAVDLDGETIKFDSSLNETKVASRFDDIGGNKKRLVESSGELFLVDMVIDDVGPYWNIVFEVKTYRLDEQKHEWTQVHTLDDRIFFAGDDGCFSLYSKDFGDQCRGNCIYYTNISMDILGEYDDPRGGLGEYSPLVGRPSNGPLSEELVHKYRELHGHNTGVFTLEDGKLGSLISFLEYADIFWPPPSWLNRQE